MLTITVETYDQGVAAEMRTAGKRFVGRIAEPTGFRVTRQAVDGVVISEPIVLMERVLE